ncbi:MAG: toxin-antitoxin system YwqK family antitoxin [Planctomycetales bacterium]|nr:toxin-antitoxin system YwqK family antitoxin [Planctomycetales bacterium]
MTVRTVLLRMGCGVAVMLGPGGGTAVFAAPAKAASSTVQQESTGDALSTDEGEVVTERYPDGQVRAEIQVALDHNENFVYHGACRVYSTNGKIIGAGRYQYGKKNGEWSRTLWAKDSQVIAENATKGFAEPFTSNAVFQDDQLQGEWTITDNGNRPLIYWQFAEGRPHGQWIWFNPDGSTRKQMQFDQGQVVNDIVGASGNGKLKVLSRYIDGRELVREVSWYTRGRKMQFEGETLKPREVTKHDIDWWNGSVQQHVVKHEGNSDRHGEWRFWHENGKLKMQGSYNRGQENGHFTWWHENGEKASEGDYVAGKMQGEWSTWYANGERKSSGQYVNGQREDLWMCWHENGMPKLHATYARGIALDDARKWDENGRRVPADLASLNDAETDNTSETIQISKKNDETEEAVSRQ